jgi:transposase
MLVNAQHIKTVPGRKTDVKDAEWIANLLRHGLVRGSFIPSRELRELRELVRYRRSLVEERTREINRIQKVLEGANIKLSSVASDVTGASGTLMLQAICNGVEDPKVLAQFAKGVMRKKLEQLEKALQGFVGSHQKLMLESQLRHIEFLNQQIEQLNQG